MDLGKVLIVIQVLVGALLATSILLQNKGASLGQAFGGSSAFYGTRRGAEKGLFYTTVVLGIIFTVLAFVALFV